MTSMLGVSHPCTESRLVQVRIFGADAMKPFRVIVQPDEFPCQILILVFGDIFPDAGQKKKAGASRLYLMFRQISLQSVSSLPEDLSASDSASFVLPLITLDSLNRSLMMSNLDFSISTFLYFDDTLEVL
ncbi:hypothetical protein NIB75_27100 [Bacteroides uniformis]|nr:hypothetical protein [Bacteroides uniformis]